MLMKLTGNENENKKKIVHVCCAEITRVYLFCDCLLLGKKFSFDTQKKKTTNSLKFNCQKSEYVCVCRSVSWKQYYIILNFKKFSHGYNDILFTITYFDLNKSCEMFAQSHHHHWKLYKSHILSSITVATSASLCWKYLAGAYLKSLTLKIKNDF